MSNQTILEACKVFGVTEANFFSRKRGARLRECRKLAALGFREKGLSWPAIARLLKRDLNTLRYWFDEKHRARRARYNANARCNGFRATDSAFNESRPNV